jgi:hypothetical protein
VLNKFYPGVEVPGLEASNLTVRVFPIGIPHIEKYVAVAGGILEEIGTLVIKRDADTKQLTKETFREVLPVITRVLLGRAKGLINETTTFSADATLDDLAHWDVAKVIEVWLEENFLKEGRLDPWLRAMKTLKDRSSAFSTLFSSSSSTGGTTPTFSTPDSPASPTEVGQLINFANGSEPLGTSLDIDVPTSSVISNSP